MDTAGGVAEAVEAVEAVDAADAADAADRAEQRRLFGVHVLLLADRRVLVRVDDVVDVRVQLRLELLDLARRHLLIHEKKNSRQFRSVSHKSTSTLIVG